MLFDAVKTEKTTDFEVGGLNDLGDRSLENYNH